VVVPVSVTLGVREDGERVVPDMCMAGEEGGASWTEVLASLVRRKMTTPILAIIDGNPGLHAALEKQWPSTSPSRDARRTSCET
jgi:transposase-like protein